MKRFTIRFAALVALALVLGVGTLLGTSGNASAHTLMPTQPQQQTVATVPQIPAGCSYAWWADFSIYGPRVYVNSCLVQAIKAHLGNSDLANFVVAAMGGWKYGWPVQVVYYAAILRGGQLVGADRGCGVYIYLTTWWMFSAC